MDTVFISSTSGLPLEPLAAPDTLLDVLTAAVTLGSATQRLLENIAASCAAGRRPSAGLAYSQLSEAVTTFSSAARSLAADPALASSSRQLWLLRARETSVAVLKLLRMIKTLYNEDW